MFSTLWQVFSFLLLFGLVLILTYVTTRLLGGRLGASAGPGRVMRVLEVLPVGRERSLLLVEVAGRFLLIGAGADAFTLLAELDDPRDLAVVAEAVARKPMPVGLPAAIEPFRQVLGRVLDRPAPFGNARPGDPLQSGEPDATAPTETGVQTATQPHGPAVQRLATSLERLRRLSGRQGGSGQP